MGIYRLFTLMLGALMPSVLALAATLTVGQKNRSFLLPEMMATRGDTIQFVNQDDFPHQIRVSGPGTEYESRLQAPGEVESVTLTQAGTFEVTCGIHPRMHMTIHVR